MKYCLEKFITNYDKGLLQIATAHFITNCDKGYYKLRQVRYYKLRQGLLQIATCTLLQIATRIITNCDRYYKLRSRALLTVTNDSKHLHKGKRDLFTTTTKKAGLLIQC